MSLTLQSIVLILVGHWIGDYVLQFNKIADFKSTSLLWLTIHVLLYTSVLLGVSLYLFSVVDAMKLSLVNGCLHFVTDWVTSKFSSRYRAKPRIFYPIIGFDQLIHTVTLMVTINYIGKS